MEIDEHGEFTKGSASSCEFENHHSRGAAMVSGVSISNVY